MPGIIGVLSRHCDGESLLTVKKSLVSMQHEVWYRVGTEVCRKLGASIGWTSHGGGIEDGIPFQNESRDLALFLVGELINDPVSVEGLRARGHQATGADGNYLINLYEEMGDAFVGTLNGSFAGALLDYKKKRIILFNDRYGMHRIFVHEGHDAFYFASEAKALLVAVPETRQFDPIGLSEYLTCGSTLGSHSLYRNIEVLPPASLWVIENGMVIEKTCFFDPKDWECDDRLSEQEFSHQIVESIAVIVRNYSRSTQSVGVSLTGGLDSRIIVACLGAESAGVPCYTFGSMYRDTADVQIAREVSRVSGHPHHVIELGQEFLDHFPRYFEKSVFISDGYLGLSGAAELYLNSLARGIAHIRLTGNYGGELLRGDRAFKHDAIQGTYLCQDIVPYVTDTKATFHRFESIDPLTFSIFRQVPYLGYGRLTIERSQVVVRIPFLDNELVRLVYRAPSQLLKGPSISSKIISRHKQELLTISTDRGIYCAESGFRSLFTNIYQEALFKAEYWSSHGMPNRLAKISHFGLGKILEKNFLGRHKFQHFRVWSQHALANYVREVLMDGTRGLEEFFNIHQIETMVEDHISGRRNYTNEIDRLMTIAMAHRTLLKVRVNS